ncbi:MAG: TetR family transcriptional regulator C-terminal domain-containing protein [Solimonas sp.]
MSKTKVRPRSERDTTPRKRSVGRPARGDQGVGQDALIEKTCELLRTMPPEQVSRAEVARYMGVDPSLIRYYFRDRSSLLLAAAQKLTRQFAITLEESLKRSGETTPEQQLQARVGAFLDMQVTYPFFHRLIIEEVVTSDAPAAKELLESLTQRGIGAYETILKRGVKEGSMRKINASMLFLSIIGMCEFFVAGLPILEAAKGAPINAAAAARQYRNFICDLVINGVRAQLAGGE